MTLLLAQEPPLPAWMDFAKYLLGSGVLAGIGLLLKRLYELRKKVRRDADEEKWNLYDRQNENLAKSQAQVATLTDLITAERNKAGNLAADNRFLRAEVKRLKKEIGEPEDEDHVASPGG